MFFAKLFLLIFFYDFFLKFVLVFRKIFSFILDRKDFLKVMKNFEISYYLLIITNLILKLLIAIYFVLIFF